MQGPSSSGSMVGGALPQGLRSPCHGRLAYSFDRLEELLSRSDLSRICVYGGNESRRRMIMEMVLREAETGERHLIVDLSGAYSSLIDYHSSLRVYKLGQYASLNPFKTLPKSYDPAKMIPALVQVYYDLNRDERIYLERSLDMVYRDRVVEPTLDDINDRLLNIQAEVQPKEAYKVECLKNVLWEMQDGALGAMLRSKETDFYIPAIFDLSPLRLLRDKALIATCLLLRAENFGATTLVLDPADTILTEDSFPQRMLLKTMLVYLDKFSRQGIMLHFGSASPSTLPKTIAENASGCLFCGPISGRDLFFVEKTFALDREESKELRKLDGDSALLCVLGKGSPIFMKPGFSEFRQLPDSEIEEHMKVLGEELVELQMAVKATPRILEKVFKDRAALVYAWEVLRLVKGGKVPVDSVSYQKNVLLKSVVKSLKRYFMIVEYNDSTGMVWYKLTKIGERAISEMEGGEDAMTREGEGKQEAGEDRDFAGAGKDDVV